MKNKVSIYILLQYFSPSNEL